MEIAITGYQLVVGLGVFALLLLSFILLLRRYYNQEHRPTPSTNWSERGKYASYDVFRHSPMYFKIGLIISLSISFLAFNYTSYDPRIDFTFEYNAGIDLENSPPVIRPAKPLPPPPPTPKVEVTIATDEPVHAVKLVAESIEPIVSPPSPPTKPSIQQQLPKPIPPPLPPVPRQPDLVIVAEVMPRMCTSCEALTLSRVEKNKCASIEMLKYVSSQLRYPIMARETDVEGVCPVKFIIESDGSISNIELLRDIGAGCGKEAIRVTELLKNKCWLPGRQNGRKVSVQMILPIRFRLQ